MLTPPYTPSPDTSFSYITYSKQFKTLRGLTQYVQIVQIYNQH